MSSLTVNEKQCKGLREVKKLKNLYPRLLDASSPLKRERCQKHKNKICTQRLKWRADCTIYRAVNSFLFLQYYLLSALGPQIRKYLWWKRYLTQIQIIQFIFDIVFLIISFFLSCIYHPIKISLGILGMSLQLSLFTHFYYVSYIAPKKTETPKTARKGDDVVVTVAGLKS